MTNRTTPTTGQPFDQEVRLTDTGELPTTTTLGIFYVVAGGPTHFDAFFATESGAHQYGHMTFEVTPIANPDAQGTPQPPWTVGGTDAGHEPREPER